MKILILNWKDIKNPDVGGAEIILYELAKRLVRDGHQVTWFCRRYLNCSEIEYVDGIEIIRRGNKVTVYFEAWRYYLSLTIKPDRVIESINTVCWQTPFYVPQNKRIAHLNQLAREVFFYELPPILSHLAYYLENYEYKAYKRTKFICYSDSVKKDLTAFGIPSQNISKFSLGIDHQRYFPGKKSKDPLFIFVARLVKMKRADLCIKAMKKVVERYPKARLVIVGYGPDEERLKKIIAENELNNRVLIVNRDNLYFERNKNEIKVKLLRQAWALFLPSVKEGWGMVVTEAAACGTPSIVSNVTGLRDSVVNGKTGFVTSINPTPEELSNYMIKIIEDRKLRDSLSVNSVKWAKNFTWEKSYREFNKLISEE